MSNQKKQIPVKEGLFTWPSTDPHLLGSRCVACGEAFFPRRQSCANCQGEKMEDIKFSKKGKLYSFTTVRYPPPLPWRGPEPFKPYHAAVIELPEGVRFLSMLTDCDPNSLKLDMDVELVIEKQYVDAEGNDVMTYKFKPIPKTRN